MRSRSERARLAPFFIVGITLLGAVVPLLAAESTTGTAEPTTDAGQEAPPMCINVADIRRTNAPDPQHLVFYMRSGKIWENTLTRSCAGLTSNRWTWVVRSPIRVCANAHRIRVFQTNLICTIGDFATPRPESKD